MKYVAAYLITGLAIAGCSGDTTESSPLAAEDDGTATAATVYGEIGDGDEKTVAYTGADYWVGYTFAGKQGDVVELTVTPGSVSADAYVYLYAGDFKRTERNAPGTTIQLVQTLGATARFTIVVHNDKAAAADFKIKLRKTHTATSDAGASATDAAAFSRKDTLFEGTLRAQPAMPLSELVKNIPPGEARAPVGEGAFARRARVCNIYTGCTPWQVDAVARLRATSSTITEFPLTDRYSGSLTARVGSVYLSSLGAQSQVQLTLGNNGSEDVSVPGGGNDHSFACLDTASTNCQGGTSVLPFFSNGAVTAGYRRTTRTVNSVTYIESEGMYFHSLIPGGKIMFEATSDATDVALAW